VAIFFIDTETGQVATAAGLEADGVCSREEQPPRPWHNIQGSSDATTMWYSVMRRRERDIFLGSLVFRHSDHRRLLAEQGWEDIPIEEIRGGPEARGGPRL